MFALGFVHPAHQTGLLHRTAQFPPFALFGQIGLTEMAQVNGSFRL